MPLESSDLAAGNEKHLVEVGLQLAHCIVLRGCVVVGDHDEIQSPTGCGIDGEEDRAGGHFPGLTLALSVAVRGMHVKVAAIPARSASQGREQIDRLIGYQATSREENVRRVMRRHLRTDVRHTYEDIPFSLRDGTGHAGGRR